MMIWLEPAAPPQASGRPSKENPVGVSETPMAMKSPCVFAMARMSLTSPQHEPLSLSSHFIALL